MSGRIVYLLLLSGLGLAACGGSPASPTPSSGLVPDTTAEAVVNVMVVQAVSQTAASGATLAAALPIAPVRIVPCPDGGNVTTTISAQDVTTNVTGASFTFSSRTEFNDCRSQNVTMRGAPALTLWGDVSVGLTSGPPSGAPTVVTSTMRTTGGVLTVASGVESLMRIDCTTVMVSQGGQLGSLPQMSWTGSIVQESPIGTVVRTSGCGPAR
jgi:hypothetical protein